MLLKESAHAFNQYKSGIRRGMGKPLRSEIFLVYFRNEE